MSYEGQLALAGGDTAVIPGFEYFGLYYRVNNNRVTAFKGPELSALAWTRLFGHYFNLILVDLVVRFLEWYQLQLGTQMDISPDAYRRVAVSLHLADVHTAKALGTKVTDALTEFEAYINNVVDGERPALSLQGAPLDELCKALVKLPTFKGKTFFFLLDEYENFEDYQQRVINTLIKQSGGNSYTFKVGVRELGWRVRTTLTETEQLISPADYVMINIAEKLQGETFNSFALQVCNERIARIKSPSSPMIRDVRQLLVGLSEDAEAERLGVNDHIQEMKDELFQARALEEARVIEDLPPLKAYLISFWSKGHGSSLIDTIHDFLSSQAEWDERYGNYKHALLYTLHRRKRGIAKYYAGWDVFTQVAASNIRYLLELVEQSLLAHLRQGENLATEVSPETQTAAAQTVGGGNLAELEGLSVDGAHLTKLTLGLGRVFQVMASDAYGHAPEVNQFELANTNGASDADSPGKAVDSLLNAAVTHSALIRAPGNKLGDVGDTRDYDYMVHPVFAPFFGFSYRRKRKMVLTPDQLLGLVANPRTTIRQVLRQSHRSPDAPLPAQLRLFGAFYGGDS